MLVLLIVPLLAGAWFVGKRLRASGFQFHIRQLAALGGATGAFYGSLMGLADGAGAAPVIGGAAFGLVIGLVAVTGACLIGNAMRDEDDRHHYPW